MIGLILAAGAGRRLRPYTDDLPKALVPVDGSRTVLDLTIANFAKVGLTDVAIIVGYKAERVVERRKDFEATYGVNVELVYNDKAEEWNNAYSLWCGRDLLSQDVVLANGDTVHPVSVEELLLEARPDNILLAMDDVKVLGEEPMKMQLDASGGLTRITKLMDPAQAAGEYIGVSWLPSTIGPDLTSALEATFTRDPNLYYEDGYQEMVNRGSRIDVQPIGDLDWVEIDDLDDLEIGRRIACHY